MSLASIGATLGRPIVQLPVVAAAAVVAGLSAVVPVAPVVATPVVTAPPLPTDVEGELLLSSPHAGRTLSAIARAGTANMYLGLIFMWTFVPASPGAHSNPRVTVPLQWATSKRARASAPRCSGQIMSSA